VRRELEPLPLATRQCGEGLAEPQVAEPHIGERVLAVLEPKPVRSARPAWGRAR